MAIESDQPRPEAQRLPRGRHGLSRTFVVENQRARIFESLAAVCAAKGYPAATVEDVIADAGVSRRTFYDLFADKETCFLAAYDAIVDRLFAKVSGAYTAGERPWPDRVASALRELSDFYASDPRLARLAMVDVLAAGRQALKRRDAALRQFTSFFAPAGDMLPAGMTGHELVAHAVIGGLYEALYTYIVDDQAAELPKVMPDLLYCALVPYIGHVAAIAARDAEMLRLAG
jgi:AcrR family transcriptional regulator